MRGELLEVSHAMGTRTYSASKALARPPTTPGGHGCE